MQARVLATRRAQNVRRHRLARWFTAVIERAGGPATRTAARFILASASPRRQELATLLGIPFDVVVSRFQEPDLPTSTVSLPEYVEDLSLRKAAEVAARYPAAFVLGADTLVSTEVDGVGVPLGKPRDAADATSMLARLSGRTHAVFTGLALVAPAATGIATVRRHVRTLVRIRQLADEMIAYYVGTGEPLDKAGAYAAQGLGATLIAGVEGDFFNVVGLPLCEVGRMLESVGLAPWRR